MIRWDPVGARFIASRLLQCASYKYLEARGDVITIFRSSSLFVEAKETRSHSLCISPVASWDLSECG